MDFVLIDEQQAHELRMQVQSRRGVWEEVAFGLRRWGEQNLDKGPWSVTFSERHAISGDPHDYFSQGPTGGPIRKTPTARLSGATEKYIPDDLTIIIHGLARWPIPFWRWRQAVIIWAKSVFSTVRLICCRFGLSILKPE